MTPKNDVPSCHGLEDYDHMWREQPLRALGLYAAFTTLAIFMVAVFG